MATDEAAPDPPRIGADNPVGRDDDALGRKGFAHLIAEQVRANRPDNGLVVAIVGDWGSGKTSVLRMVAEELSDAPSSGDHGDELVFEFNPWLFSGSEQLTALFFVALSSELDEDAANRSDAADRLRSYARALGTLRSLPAIGGLFGAGADIAEEASNRVNASVDLITQRRELEDSLRELDTHIVVLIDDVDRLQTASEIRDLMRMVKLVGDLPGITYVLSYDRRPVVAALTSSGISGNEYLEKIVQVEHRLPAVAADRLIRMLEKEINAVIHPLPQDHLDMDRWPEVFSSIVQPLVKTPRHVRRYGNALQLSIRLHRDEVDLVDQLALAAVATFLPGFHSQLAGLSDVLLPRMAFMSSFFDRNESSEAKDRLEAAASESGEPAVVLALYSLLFPGTERILNNSREGSGASAQRRRRVADPEAFLTYLTAAVPEDGVSVAEVRQFLRAAENDDSLREELDARDLEEFARLCVRLRAHVADISPERVTAVARIVMGEARRRFPAWRQSIDDPTSHVEFFVVDLVEQIPAPERNDFLSSWGAESEDPNHKLSVYEVARYKDKSGATLLDEAKLEELNAALADSVCALPASDIAARPEVGRLLFLTGAYLETRDLDKLRSLLADDLLFARYLLIFTELSFGDGPRPLAWRGLEENLGAEWLRSRVEAVTGDEVFPEALAEVMATARRHADEATNADRH